MKGFLKFMASAYGRGLRIIAGIGLIAWGIMGIGGTNGYIVAAIGVVPILTGLINICAIGPLFGGPLSGSKACKLD